MKRSDEHTKHRLGSLNSTWKMSRPLSLDREKQNAVRREREGEQTQTLNHFSFSIVVLVRVCSRVSSSQVRSRYETPFRSSPKMIAAIFGRIHIIAAFTSSHLVSNWIFSSFSILRPLPLLLRLNFPHPIRIRRRLAANTFLFLTRASAAIPTLT